jgi:hypothetical protein
MGFRAQLLFFLDELIPSLFGKPLLPISLIGVFLPGIEGTATGAREWTDVRSGSREKNSLRAYVFRTAPNSCREANLTATYSLVMAQ